MTVYVIAVVAFIFIMYYLHEKKKAEGLDELDEEPEPVDLEGTVLAWYEVEQAKLDKQAKLAAAKALAAKAFLAAAEDLEAKAKSE